MRNTQLTDLESSTQHESQRENTEGSGIFGWLAHHAQQIVKGSLALLGLVILGGAGYFAQRALVGFRKTNDIGDTASNGLGLVPQEEAYPIAIANAGLVGDSSSALTSLSGLPKVWAKEFGGDDNTGAYSVLQTTDGGYVVVGDAYDAELEATGTLILRLDSFGNKVWTKIFESVHGGTAYSIRQTRDGGYVVAGVTLAGIGNDHILVFKLDEFGNKMWAQVFGGNTEDDRAESILQTTDGGYTVVGSTRGRGTGLGKGQLILRLDNVGHKLWARRSNRANAGTFDAIQQVADGGYIVVGSTNSTRPDKLFVGEVESDALVLKLDEFGNEIWAKTFGGVGVSYAGSIQQTTDGGYVVAGQACPEGTGAWYPLVFKLDSSGNKVWAKKTSTGASYYQILLGSIQQTTDGGYILAGSTNAREACGVLVLKLDSLDNKIWAREFGENVYGGRTSIQQTIDGGYIVSSNTQHDTGVKSFNDILVLKLDASGNLRSGCWGKEVPVKVIDSDLVFGDVSWESQDLSGVLTAADQFTLADWKLTSTIICGRNVTRNVPIATQDFCCTAGIGQRYGFALANDTFIDPLGRTLIYTTSGLPGWLIFNAGFFSGIPVNVREVADWPMTVTATSEIGDYVSDNFTLRVMPTLNATNLAAIIHYIENTACKLAPIAITTPSTTVAAKLILDDTNAGSLTTGRSGDAIAVFDPATGIWQVSGNREEVNALLANLWYQPAGDYHGGFKIAVKITDSFEQSLNSTLTVPALIVPTLAYHSFVMLIGDRVILTTKLLSAEDPSVTSAALVFAISQMQYGRFTLTAAPEMAIFAFTKQQIAAGQVQLLHNGSEGAVAFWVKVNNGVASSPLISVTTVLHHYTTLMTGAILIGNGENLVVTLDMLNAYNPDDTPEQLTFIVSKMQYGNFELLSDPGVKINRFTMQQVINRWVNMVHDGSSNPPLFSVTVADDVVTTMPVEVRAKFKTPIPTPARDSSTSSPVFNLAMGAIASGITSFGFWVAKRKYTAHKKREKEPFANRVRRALKLGISDFESGKGMEFLNVIHALVEELLQHGVDVKRLTHRELQELSIPVAKAMSAVVKKERYGCVFSSNTIDCKKAQDEISTIASNAIAEWKRMHDVGLCQLLDSASLVSPLMGDNS